jgi:hypothetical protein
VENRLLGALGVGQEAVSGAFCGHQAAAQVAEWPLEALGAAANTTFEQMLGPGDPRLALQLL